MTDAARARDDTQIAKNLIEVWLRAFNLKWHGQPTWSDLEHLADAFALALAAAPTALHAQATAADSARLERLKAEALAKVDPKLVQEIVDQLFSFSELGMQEFETQRYKIGRAHV